ncbi:unnamed protein product, partial [Closterium sp. NIES-64]
DTFRGRVCQCPSDPVSGVNYVGDGYKKCSPQGVGRCRVNHGGCWNAEHSGQTFSACDDTSVFGTGCSCPSGFTGDGYTCTDVDECAADSTVCKCPDCHCSNTFGSFDCSCPGGLLYMRDSDTCINGGFTSHMFGKILAIVVAALILAALISFGIYKYRLRAYMDSEIRTIMAQYMPLDSQQQDGATRESLVQSA